MSRFPTCCAFDIEEFRTRLVLKVPVKPIVATLTGDFSDAVLGRSAFVVEDGCALLELKRLIDPRGFARFTGGFRSEVFGSRPFEVEEDESSLEFKLLIEVFGPASFTGRFPGDVVGD